MQTLFVGLVHWRRQTKMPEMVLGMVGVLLIGLLETMAVSTELVTRQAVASQLEEPQAGTWKPLVLTSASQFRPPPPPPTSATKAEIKVLQVLARERDSAALDRINFWDVGGPMYRWNEIATDQISKKKLSPPHSARARALVNAAIYDAIIAAWDAKYTYRRPRPSAYDSRLAALGAQPHSPAYPSEHAVVAGAAAAILADLFPDTARLFDDLAEEAGKSRLLAGVHYPSDVTAGLALGRAVASLVLERARSDGSQAVWAGTVPQGPGYWQGMAPLVPMAGQWKTWVLSSGSQLRPMPPPAWGSLQLDTDLAEVKDFPRTAKSMQAAFFWQSRGGQFFYDLTNQKIFEYRLDMSPPRAARVYALVSIAAYDATIACWDAKYTYWMMRPTQLAPDVTALFPPPQYPSYPSSAACSWGATAAMLAYFFPGDAVYLQDKAEEASLYPFWAGIHFRRDCEVGLAIGRSVARLVLEQVQHEGTR
jgi:hypothetical protein